MIDVILTFSSLLYIKAMKFEIAVLVFIIILYILYMTDSKGYLMIGASVATVAAITVCDGKYRVKGGQDEPRRSVWHGPDLPNYDVAKYAKCEAVIKKISRSFGVKYNRNMYSTFYEIYKIGRSKGKKKWGNTVSISTKTYKFSDSILNVIKEMPDPEVYMDFGCGDGRLAREISTLIPDARTYCVDAGDFREYKDSNFVLNDKPGVMAETFKDESVSVITASQVLHHVNFDDNGPLEKFEERLKFILSRMTAALKPGGLLLIREHDVYSLDRLYPVILEHLMFALMEIEDKNLSFGQLREWVNRYHLINDGWYFSKRDIIGLLEDMGLKQMAYENKAGANPSHIFNVLFQKSEN
jgi:SAM-dependent methyltransferase